MVVAPVPAPVRCGGKARGHVLNSNFCFKFSIADITVNSQTVPPLKGQSDCCPPMSLSDLSLLCHTNKCFIKVYS